MRQKELKEVPFFRDYLTEDRNLLSWNWPVQEQKDVEDASPDILSYPDSSGPITKNRNSILKGTEINLKIPNVLRILPWKFWSR
jgi:hypothetical protein